MQGKNNLKWNAFHPEYIFETLNPVIWEKIQAMGKTKLFPHGEKFYKFLFHWLFYHKN